MSRKWMAWVLLPAMAVALWGCPKKEPEMPPQEMEMEEEAPMEPAEEVPAEPEMAMEDERQPELPSDIVELNRYLRDQGLVDDIYFDFDQADLRPEARDQLQKNAEWLRSHPEYDATIEGHCDERGTNAYNLALGNRRANTAKDYLSSLGVGDANLKTISYGEEKPVCTESTESCWQRNRRAHFVIYPK